MRSRAHHTFPALVGAALGCASAEPERAAPKAAPPLHPGVVAASARDGGVLPPWSTRCREALAAAEVAFRREAPAAFPDYTGLSWSADGAVADAPDLAWVEVAPGRSWFFRAAIVDDAQVGRVPSNALQAAAEATGLTATWRAVEDEEAHLLARRVGSAVAVVGVWTERLGRFATIEAHPLAALFVGKLRLAAETCLPAVRAD
jgi:hypothetical protein